MLIGVRGILLIGVRIHADRSEGYIIADRGDGYIADE